VHDKQKPVELDESTGFVSVWLCRAARCQAVRGAACE
jgi:hypothetical protein